MDEEEVQLVEGRMRAAGLDENGDEKTNETKVSDKPEPPMRIVNYWKRHEERIPVARDPTKFVRSSITGELIDPWQKEQKEKERMMAKNQETTLAHDDEISRNIVGLPRTRPDIFGTTAEWVSNAVKAEIEKKKEEQTKQVIVGSTCFNHHSNCNSWDKNGLICLRGFLTR